MPNFESDEGDDGDYGMDLTNPLPRRELSPEEIRAQEYSRKKRDRERQVSQNFNSHMIYLFNSRS